jgi:hypothetical protein
MLDWHSKGLITIGETAEVLSYSREKVRQMLKHGDLEGRGKGAGLRIVVASIKRYLTGEQQWPANERHDAPKARVHHGSTGKIIGTSGRLNTKADGTALQGATKQRRVFDLKH